MTWLFFFLTRVSAFFHFLIKLHIHTIHNVKKIISHWKQHGHKEITCATNQVKWTQGLDPHKGNQEKCYRMIKPSQFRTQKTFERSEKHLTKFLKTLSLTLTNIPNDLHSGGQWNPLLKARAPSNEGICNILRKLPRYWHSVWFTWIHLLLSV